MAKPTPWNFYYSDLQRCTGLSYDTICQHAARGKFDPQKLESVVLYLAKYGSNHFRQSIVDAAIVRQNEAAVGALLPRRRASSAKGGS